MSTISDQHVTLWAVVEVLACSTVSDQHVTLWLLWQNSHIIPGLRTLKKVDRELKVIFSMYLVLVFILLDYIIENKTKRDTMC